LPLSARARIEVYLPDLLSLASQELLIAFNQEFGQPLSVGHSRL
jgi:hypothetical protein